MVSGRLVLEAAPDYDVALLSPGGTVTTWNAGATRPQGYQASEVIGRHLSMFYPAADVEAGTADSDLEVARRDGRYQGEGWRARPDGSRFWAGVTMTALHAPDGGLRGFSVLTRDLTDRRRLPTRATDRLRDARRRVLDTLPEGALLYGVDGTGATALELANPAAYRLLDLEPDPEALQALSRDPASFGVIDREGAPLQTELPFALTARTGESVQGFVWARARPGVPTRWLSSDARPVHDASGAMTGVLFSLVDITEAFNTRRELETAYARFATLVEHSSDAICIVDPDAVVRYASGAYQQVYGEPPAARLGRSLTERLHPQDQDKVSDTLARLVGAPEGAVTFECRAVHADRRVVHLEVTAANYLADPAIRGIVTSSRDITERVLTAARLAHEAMHDPLTGLANRALLLDRLTQSLLRAQRTDERCALLFADLDHFKRINDSFGHTAGDRLLSSVAHRLKRILRPGDTVARVGGDEFVILAEEVADAEAARALAERVRVTVNQPVEVGDRMVTIGCSVGVTISDGSRPEVLLQQADTALYQAKARGRGRSDVFDQAMRHGAQRRVEIEDRLRRTLAAAGLDVHYQPIVSLATRIVLGHEALARLVDDQGEPVAPAEFIPIAEDDGLIVPLGMEVLRRACAQQARWSRLRRAPTWVAVNLSGRELRAPDLVAGVSACLAAAGLAPTALCVELPESALTEADHATRRAVYDLSNLGIAIALDDFGSGISSLVHLRRFPISILKIDRSFVAGLGLRREDTEVVKAVVGLGRALGLSTVAEGVETSEQADILVELGCEEAQGYLFGAPAPPEH
jgi:diguanylate cyclase (GGDEF)-like protein/PAS domain S-box-containing protein